MAYPVWISPVAGSLGKIAAQQFYELALNAVEPTPGATITYSLVAGLLPKGLQVNPNGMIEGNPEKTYVLTGVPFSVNQDVTSTFTIRATSSLDNSVTDRTFSITVTGNFPPEILPTTTLIVDADVENDILGNQFYTSKNNITLSNGQIIKFVGLTDPVSYNNNEYTVRGVGTSIELIPYTQDIGTFLDGTSVTIQLQGFDANDDVLEWKLIDGSLPPGTSLSSTGVISGLLLPVTNEFNNSITGWSKAKWNRDNWEFATKSSNAVYNFTVSLSDGKVVVSKKYKMQVYAYNAITADNTVILSDNSNITVDIDANRPPILITTSLGASSVVNSGGYFAFKFDGVDFDGYPVEYNLQTASDLAWDDQDWDTIVWDQIEFTLPPGLSLDTNTGWLTGYIPAQAETQIDYTFAVYVNSTVGPLTESEPRLFTLTILGNLDLAVEWITDSDLGTLDIGEICNLQVEAIAKSGRELFYTLEIDSRLPQGLTLLTDGSISGRVSFNRMGFDRGTTTFDVTLSEKFVYNRPTNFDNVYNITVTAQDYAGDISSTKTFTIRLDPVTYEPYENLFIRCLPPIEKRDILFQIINNTDIFEPDDIYRPLDPYYGLQPEIKFLVSYGIKASKLSEYIEAMGTRHFPKKFYFGDFKIAQAKDETGNALYDVLYVDLIEETKRYEQLSNGTVKKYIPASSTTITKTKATWKNPRAEFLPANQLKTSSAASVDKGFVQTNSSWYNQNPLDTIYPNDLTLMQLDITNNLENTFLNSLPEWMISVQDDTNQIMGYTSGAVLAYLKPGTAKKALFRIQKYIPYDIKLVPFVSDRYVLNNSYTQNFNLDTRRFVTNKYTTFDENNKGGVTITPVYDVDFAVNRPFDSIHNRTLDYVIGTGGLDGVTYNLNGKYLIFAQQENFIGWGTLTNDGWNRNELILNNYKWDSVGWDKTKWDGYQTPVDVVIPGYLEKLSLFSIANQRAGVWQLFIDSNNYIKLYFIKEIFPEEYVFVKQGSENNTTYQKYDLNALNQGFTVPKYTKSTSSILMPGSRTTFDRSNTRFINNIDTYTIPFQGDKYLKFPKIGVFSNGQ